MKSILVAIDHTEASRTAQGLAIELACRHKAQLTGLGILDRAAIARPEPVPVGAMTFKVQKDRALLNRERHFLAQAMHCFVSQCQTMGLEPQILNREGHQLAQLEREAARHDVIVIGRDTEFSPFESDIAKVSKTVTGILRDYPRPVIVTPPSPLAGERMLIIYDGRPGSDRLLQILTMLGLPEGFRVQVLGLGNGPYNAGQNAQFASEYLADHDVSACIVPSENDLDDERLILNTAQKVGAKFVAFATGLHCGWRRLLHGSTDRCLLQKCSSALIVYR